jgi:hypothetical protein
MFNARVLAAGVWFVAVCSIPACGGGSDDTEPPPASNPAPSTSAAPNNPAPASDATGSACVAASCPTLTLFGNAAPGCCQATGSCGGNIMYMGTPFCAPPNIEQVAAQIAEPFEELDEEEIVTADECPGLAFQGTTIPGCCDQTGVCGVSTAGFASTPDSMLPFNIPVTCISEAEARQFGALPAGAADAGPPIACNAGD